MSIARRWRRVRPWRRGVVRKVQRRPGGRPESLLSWRKREPRRGVFGKISAKCCSFSAVSAPIFARKYAFCSIFQNQPDFLVENFEIWQNFADFATFAQCLLNFHKNGCFFKPIFCENFEIAAVQKDANLVELEKCCQTHILLQNFVLIQPRTSPPKIYTILPILRILLILLTLTPNP